MSKIIDRIVVWVLITASLHPCLGMDADGRDIESGAQPSAHPASKPRYHFAPWPEDDTMTQLRKCALSVEIWVLPTEKIFVGGVGRLYEIKKESALFSLRLSPKDDREWLPGSNIGKALKAKDWNTFCDHAVSHSGRQRDDVKIALNVKDVSFLPNARLDDLLALVAESIMPGAPLHGLKVPEPTRIVFYKQKTHSWEERGSRLDMRPLSLLIKRHSTALVPLSEEALQGKDHFFHSPQASQRCLVDISVRFCPPSSEEKTIEQKKTQKDVPDGETTPNILLVLPPELIQKIIRDYMPFYDQLSLMENCSTMTKHGILAGVKLRFLPEQPRQYDHFIFGGGKILDLIQKRPTVPVTCYSFNASNEQKEAFPMELIVKAHPAEGYTEGESPQAIPLTAALYDPSSERVIVTMNNFFTSDKSHCIEGFLCVPRIAGMMSEQIHNQWNDARDAIKKRTEAQDQESAQSQANQKEAIVETPEGDNAKEARSAAAPLA
ncbi:hypothetical protein [Candidatus Hepatobacter penaei]|uniref:hypothetical protein n=1 Tax=Candidatus Hepatobacter penaei TaxID=1274402 RepID=UPI0012DFFAD6|nr:hypothetical protein [Candidatus Hepatobacter penaei]